MKREHGPMDDKFEAGYAPMDSPPGIEEREYKRWKDAGGKVIQQANCQAHRANARSMLENRAADLRRRADMLDALSKALPLELPQEADEALWLLMANYRP